MAPVLAYDSQVKINTPHAAVLLWNYIDRIDPNGTLDANDIDEVIISTLSLISISTSKSKSTPAGTFEITLAPTKNWVKTITPGSWFVVLMSSTTKIEQQHFQKADSSMVKFFGRVDSVVVNVGVDPESGARMTTYNMIGSDWGQIFDSILYVDPVARTPNETAIATAGRFIYDQYIADISNARGLPTSTTNVKKLIELWGSTNTTFKTISEITSKDTTVVVKPEISFAIPLKASQFFGFTDANGVPTNKLTQIVAGNMQFGKLTSYDTYEGEANSKEAIGIIQPNSIFGTHSFWQLLQDNCNQVINELVTDIRWDPVDANGAPVVGAIPKLTLYKRVKPFITRDPSLVYMNPIHSPKGAGNAQPDHAVIDPVISNFEYVRRVLIPLENITAISAGTNWRDKYNYAEIQVDHSLLDDSQSIQVKINAAISDNVVFGREGFRPRIEPTKYLPATADGAYNPLKIYNWKYVLKEWYFNTHNLLNGQISFVGIDSYIQVGDNILVNADILGITNNMNTANLQNPKQSFLLAHVESISHQFHVNSNEDGARTFSTTIQFVRGIITDQNGHQFQVTNITNGSGQIDVDAALISASDETNSVNVFSTSSNNDAGIKQDGTLDAGTRVDD